MLYLLSFYCQFKMLSKAHYNVTLGDFNTHVSTISCILFPLYILSPHRHSGWGVCDAVVRLDLHLDPGRQQLLILQELGWKREIQEIFDLFL